MNPKISIKNHDEPGLILAKSYPNVFSDDTDARPLVFCENPDSLKLEVQDDENALVIFAPDLTRFWVALGDWMSGELTPDHPIECGGIQSRIVMLDASRNAVPTIPFLKSYIMTMALNGLTGICLYTEDTYTVPQYPLFGYGRGAYTPEEIQELDNFCFGIGIELFPCIQTLGHFEQFLRYTANASLQDNPRVLNTNLDETYHFIENIIAAATSYYRSNRIHLGLDEPWGLGRGKSLDFNHPVLPAERFVNHLIRVNEICEKYELSPMIWGDYLLGHSGEEAISPELLEKIPKTIQMVYWDYTHTALKDYTQNIKHYKKLGFQLAGAPTTHSFGRFFPEFNEMEKTATPFIESMIRNNVDTMVFTLWGDDGHECLNMFALPTLIYALSAARGFARDVDFWSKRLKIFSDFSEIQVRQLATLSEPKIVVSTGPDTQIEVTGKMLLWDDPLHRFILRMLMGTDLFHDIKWKWFHANISSESSPYIQWIKQYCDVIAQKVEIVHFVSIAYHTQNKYSIRSHVAQIPQLVEKIKELHKSYRLLWLKERKPFGLEIIDHRFGGLIMRLELLYDLAQMWSSNEIESIDELGDFRYPQGLTRADLAFHNRIFTRCYQLWT